MDSNTSNEALDALEIVCDCLADEGFRLPDESPSALMRAFVIAQTQHGLRIRIDKDGGGDD